VARRHGTLTPVASVYSVENDQVYEGIDRPGVPLVTLAPMRKFGVFPLGEAVCELLTLARGGLGGEVEIEFAVNLSEPEREMALLQVRPATLPMYDAVSLGPVETGSALVGSCRALGAGSLDSIADIVAVMPETFDRARTPEIAQQIGALNDMLQEAERPYVLIGPGRWGTADRWLGIPVPWSAIAGARVIVETGLEGVDVPPSDGAHFFHNVVSLGIGYFTARQDHGGAPLTPERVDWEWLAAQPHEPSPSLVRHVRLTAPLAVRIDGRRGEGVVLKPDRGPASGHADPAGSS
jgi:hypothetical protein